MTECLEILQILINKLPTVPYGQLIPAKIADQLNEGVSKKMGAVRIQSRLCLARARVENSENKLSSKFNQIMVLVPKNLIVLVSCEASTALKMNLR
jgi:hypothetical protein